MVEKQMTQLKSIRHTPIRVWVHTPIRATPLESPMGNPHVDKDTTGKAKSHAFDPTDV